MMIDADTERFRNAVGGDVVMGRPDAAGGEDVGVATAQRVQRGDDVGLVVGHDAYFLEVDPDIGQVFRNKADILVLGPPGQDLVADHQNSRGDDIAHDLSSPCIFVTLRKQRIEVTGFCCRNKHPAAIFSGSTATIHTKCSPRMHIALARALLPSLSVMHCPAWRKKSVGIYGSCVRRNEWARRRASPGLSRALPLAQGDAAGRPGISPPGGGIAVPPDRHHLCRLWRRRSPGTADSLRRDPADHVRKRMHDPRKWPEAAGARD